MPQYVQKLDQVQLTKAQQEIVTVVLRDTRMPENRKFFRVRDVIFEALARDARDARGCVLSRGGQRHRKSYDSFEVGK